MVNEMAHAVICRTEWAIQALRACDEFDTLFMSTTMSAAFPVSNVNWRVIQLFLDGLWQIIKDDCAVVCRYDKRFLFEMLLSNVFVLLLHAWPLGLMLAGRGMEVLTTLRFTGQRQASLVCTED
jgi:hypothetical protein